MTVRGETGPWCRYMDLTAQTEALYDFVMLTIEHELMEELDSPASCIKVKQAIQEIVDLPGGLTNRFIRLCLLGGGRLSATKREFHFDLLTDEELSRMEDVIRTEYN
jgi:hypothetical protein